ncbi:hypothetical protein [Pseudomonas sp. GZD-222]|uniref:hypothetical protein n=1 Tax=Pseudomonas sp. GZD-222 TaxID=3404805 RepID=UPI003BB73A31
MQTVKILNLTPETEEICAIRLVGGFDSKRKHYPASDLSNFDSNKIFDEINEYHSPEHASAIKGFERKVICALVMAEDLIFDGVRYVFDVKSFTEPESLKWLALGVMAQIIEE